MKAALLACLLTSLWGAPGPRRPGKVRCEAHAAALEGDDPAAWPAAVRGLAGCAASESPWEWDMEPTRVERILFAALGKVGAEDQLWIVRHLERKAFRKYAYAQSGGNLVKYHLDSLERIAETFLQLAREGKSTEVAEAALSALFGLEPKVGRSRLGCLLAQGAPNRGALAAMLLTERGGLPRGEAAWVQERYTRAGRAYAHANNPAWIESYSALDRVRMDEDCLAALILLLRGQDRQVRLAAISILAFAEGSRVDDALFGLLEDSDPEVRNTALGQLAGRGDFRALEPLIEHARTCRVDKDVGSRSRHHVDPRGLAGELARADLPGLIDLYKQADWKNNNEAFREILQHVNNAPGKFHPAVRPHLQDPDPVLRNLAKRVLRAELRRAREVGDEERFRGYSRDFLAAAALVSGILGAALLVMAFRMLMLKRLLRGLAPSRARSAALGLVCLRGEAQPAGGYLTHPLTGEACLYYPWAGLEHPRHRFYIVDDTGKVLVEPRGAVLLSEDSVVSAGEPVCVLGTAQWEKAEGGERVVVGRRYEPGPAAELLGGFLLRLALDAGVRGTAPMLFSPARQCLWIWDEAHEPPMASNGDVARMVLVFVIAGGWIAVFACSTLAALMPGFASGLSRVVGPLPGL